MAHPSYLTKRGNIYWFRRRPPCIFRLHEARSVRYIADEASSHPPAMGHQAVSLKTSCPREARRRAARANALFEYGWQQFEQAMNQHTPPSGDPNFQQQFAQQMLDLLRSSVEQAARLSAQVLPPPQQAAAQHATETSLRRQIAAAVPVPPSEKKSRIDDPEFEAALLAAAEREGWWHDDPDDIVEQMDWMLVGLMTLQEDYVKYCARKRLDPATALPSLSRLAAGVSGMAEAIGVAVPPAATPPQPALPKPAIAAKATPNLLHNGTKLSEFAARYLDLRSAGYEC